MRGTGITNIYVIHGKEYRSHELSRADKEMIEQCADKSAYNQLRNSLLQKYGDDFVCTIRIHFPGQLMEVSTADGQKPGN